MSTISIFLAILFSTVCLGDGARILGIAHQNSYSHFILADRIYRNLAERGHEVTLITPFEQATPVTNFKHVVLTGYNEQLNVYKENLLGIAEINVVTEVIEFHKMCLLFVDLVLNHPNVQKLLKSDQKFDVVIHEKFVNDAFHGFAYHYKVPSIVIGPVGVSPETSFQMGNPHNPSYIPDILLTLPRNMNFFERFINSIAYVSGVLLNEFFTLPKQNELLQKYFPGAPDLRGLLHNTSLFFLNTHVSIGPPVPLVPNMVEIGGYHLLPAKPLPQELQTYLDSAKQGAIFMSMGSNLKSKDLPEKLRNDILKSFAKLKQKVLWKWEDDSLPGIPSNVKMGKWLPQQDILAHLNVKLFITHGGLLSIIEAVNYGIPILGIPVFGDQGFNVRNAEHAGYGMLLPYEQINEITLSSYLQELLTNQTYATNAKRVSRIMHDQPTLPLERAMYWIEYIIRHQGAPHLRTAVLDLTWYQYLLLDVALFLFVVVAAVLLVIYKIVKLIRCFKRKNVLDRNKKIN